jgi:hypothetical protein
VLIGIGEKLCGSGFDEYEHVYGYIGDMRVIEAEPGGARVRVITEFYPAGQRTLWSTGAFDLTSSQRDEIVYQSTVFLDTPYSWLDYDALGLHYRHIPAPGLREYIRDSGHMICSQYWDRMYQLAGYQLFKDNRWNGYVLPSHMAGLIKNA